MVELMVELMVSYEPSSYEQPVPDDCLARIGEVEPNATVGVGIFLLYAAISADMRTKTRKISAQSSK
jgi:hypothetical protein